jgi:hypothetical protein
MIRQHVILTKYPCRLSDYVFLELHQPLACQYREVHFVRLEDVPVING